MQGGIFSQKHSKSTTEPLPMEESVFKPPLNKNIVLAEKT